MTDFASPAPRNASAWIRQIHRWLSILFTVSVIVTFVALALPEPLVWVSYIPLAPLVDWTQEMTGFWESRFDDLENLLGRMDQ